MSSKYKRLFCDMGIFALGTLGSKIIVFFLLPLYTHVLTTEEYGVSDLIFTLAQLISPFISLAIYNGLLRYGLMKGVKAEDAYLCANRVFIIGSIATVALTPLLGLIPSIKEWRWFLCLYVISSFANTNCLIYLKVKDKNKLYALLSIVQTLLLVGSNIIFLIIFKMGVRGYLLSYISSSSITVILATWVGGMFKDLRIAKYDSQLMKAMTTFSLPYILNDISWWVIHSSNKLIIEFTLGSAILGVYTTAAKVPSMINVIASIFSQAWGLSSIKEYESSSDYGFYSEIFNYFFIVVFGVGIFVIAIIKLFMRFYVSETFFEAWQYIPLLLIGAVFSTLSSFAGSLLGALKKPEKLMWSTLMAGIVNVIINVIFIPFIGLWGAVLGTLIAYIIVALFRLASVKKNVRIDYNLKRNIPIVFIAIVQAVLVSMDYHIVLTSIIAFVFFFCIIYKDIRKLLLICIKNLKNIRFQQKEQR